LASGLGLEEIESLYPKGDFSRNLELKGFYKRMWEFKRDFSSKILEKDF